LVHCLLDISETVWLLGLIVVRAMYGFSGEPVVIFEVSLSLLHINHYKSLLYLILLLVRHGDQWLSILHPHLVLFSDFVFLLLVLLPELLQFLAKSLVLRVLLLLVDGMSPAVLIILILLTIYKELIRMAFNVYNSPMTSFQKNMYSSFSVHHD
jgi:hypothetical protein